ncbi:hypothetical protein Kpol_1064p17 [Vanderwaltozyma polyspora DSM 70294]|uniref:Transferrin receptor-like dimerisation domain-containing protein n=1 Tax=Vanderwaltozyma polyspora (strain ATCC 22028 / DSM 70294 / BCRC 21397 / CBS 2163 / NBRC 10782 / NRRL Y-8283 / UCD 57-17) TaxID=436907 RepID=A7TME2_VANPO|nr:uncharacterized protein Kpol_1064p17 [Vanderwaltozyma polyspora DSM 70294]EDO16536.1 hypothetical protein Kpol_1064p17 [Vanderwaltozyma polyspora DSM 70294]
MRLPRDRRYDRLPNEEPIEDGNEVEGNGIETGVEGEADEGLPIEPPRYIGGDVPDDLFLGRDIEEMQVEEPESTTPEVLSDKFRRFRNNINERVVIPVQEHIIDPMTSIMNLLSEKVDFQLNKIGNPLILRRFFYIIFMSIVTYIVVSSGLLPTDKTYGINGGFSDHSILMEYARAAVDLAKLERDLEYISSMPHMSGTKGDAAIRQYISQSFTNNGLKSVFENEYPAYANYYESASLSIITSDGETKNIELTEENWNPLSWSGSLSDVNLIYGGKCTFDSMNKLKDSGMLESDFLLLIHYDKLVSQQILIAQKYNAKGIIFISDSYNGNNDVVKMKSVALPQYWPGDILTPGWVGSVVKPLDPKDSLAVPHIPTLPLSYNQANGILSLIPKEGVEFEDGHFSGKPGSIKVSMSVENTERNRHPVHNVVAKLQGREQGDRSIIIAAPRNTIGKGAIYPDFGTVLLLTLAQLFEQIKYKFDWHPLRSIYFISFGGTEFNNAGATEFVEHRRFELREDVYSVIDISQLGITDDSKKIDVQTHPLLRSLFKNENMKSNFDISVSNVHQYGDWTPFYSAGIPVSVLSTNDMLQGLPVTETSADTFDHLKDLLADASKRELITDIILYAFQSCLNIADIPLIPFDILDFHNFLNDAINRLDDNYKDQLNFSGIRESLKRWKYVGNDLISWKHSWNNIVVAHNSGFEPSILSLHRYNWNKKLFKIGASQTYAAGIYNRPFYKNIILGPTFWSTEEVNEDTWTFPGLRDAVKDENWNEAQHQLEIIANSLKSSAEVFLDTEQNIIM